jgi:hypothetical protein
MNISFRQLRVFTEGRPPREIAMRAETFAAHPRVFVAPRRAEDRLRAHDAPRLGPTRST